MAKKKRSFTQVARTHYGLVMICAIAGAGLGALATLIAALQGWMFGAIVGAVVGAPSGVLLYWLLKRESRFALEKVTLNLVGQEVEFMLNAEFKKVAWRLFVETVTRIATQPLSPQGGHLREAMNSLHNLFGDVREMLRDMQPTPTESGKTVEMLAVQMLNHELRPFLSKWHRALTAHEKVHGGEAGWPQEAEFRAELEALREKLLKYSRAYAKLAGVKQIGQFFKPLPVAPIEQLQDEQGD